MTTLDRTSLAAWESGPLPTDEQEQQALSLFAKDSDMWLWSEVLQGTRNDYRRRIKERLLMLEAEAVTGEGRF